MGYKVWSAGISEYQVLPKYDLQDGIVFEMKGLAGGSRFVFFFKTYSSRDCLGMFFPGNLWY